MSPAIIIGIILLCVCLISSSVGGYLVMNASPAPEPETETETETSGCTSPGAENYNEDATKDDGSCTYPVRGCMDSPATNYSPSATEDDDSCTYNNLFNFKSNDDPAKCIYTQSDGDGRVLYKDISGDSSESCTAFNIIVDKNGNITDTAQKITIAGSEKKMCAGIMDGQGNRVGAVDCETPEGETYFFTTDENRGMNMNAPAFESPATSASLGSPYGIGEKLHVYAGSVHKNSGWGAPTTKVYPDGSKGYGDDLLEGTFVLQA